MTTRAPVAALDDRELYPLHEEDDVPEIPFHRRQVRYLCRGGSARAAGGGSAGSKRGEAPTAS
jgi:hypothetical protein